MSSAVVRMTEPGWVRRAPTIVLTGAKAGSVALRFEGRLSTTKKLEPGPYRLTLVAVDAAGRTSGLARATFTVAP